MSKIELRIREEMVNSGKTPYVVAKETGVNASELSRFLNRKTSLSISNADTLCQYFGLQLVRA